MTNNQKEFLLEYFFKNQYYPGWKSIANKLLNTGKCIVAGNNCIWIEGIGNFIQVEKAEDAIDCSLYTFDLKNFLNSEWFKEIHNQYINILANKKKEIENEYKEITNL